METREDSIKVFIADHQPLFRRGIHDTLNAMPDIEICEEGDADNKVLEMIETLDPDVVLMDTDPPSLSGIKLCQDIKRRFPSVAVVMLAPHLDDNQLFQSIKAQAAAYISKDVNDRDLATIIRRCARGEHPINESLANWPKVAERILQQFHELARETAGLSSPLTPRETEILDYMAKGYLNKQIAEALTVSEQTIKNHITSILRKLNVNARTQAVVVAIKKGLITINRE